MASEQQLVISASEWPTLPGQQTAIEPKKSWGAVDRRSSEVLASCDTSCASDDGASSRGGDDAGYTSDEGSSWTMSANAPAFVPASVADAKTSLDAKAVVFVPGSGSQSWYLPIVVKPPPGLVEEVPAIVQPPPGLRAGLSTKARAFVPKAEQ